MTRKPGLTRRQHVELGAELQDIRERAMNAAVSIAGAYPGSSIACRRARRVIEVLDALRCELDSRSARELPGDLWSPTIYFGANRDARNAWLAANPLGQGSGSRGRG